MKIERRANNMWRTARLGDVATIERDAVQPELIAQGTAYLGLEHIESGGEILGARAVDEGELASSKFKFTKRHLLYGKLRPYLAKIALPDFEGICSTDILPILPGADLDRGFLCYFLRQPSVVDYANARAVGINLPRLSPSTLAEFEMPLPPLAEQRRIAEVLDRAEAVRTKRRAILAELDCLTQSIFCDVFGDPITNPKNWPKRVFGEVCDTRLGKMLDEKQQTGEHRRPYLRNANVQWFRFDLAEVFEMDFDENARKVFRLEDGDLLICEGGEPGRAAVWRGEIKECYYQKALHRARPKKDLAISDFLAWQLWFLAHRGGLNDHVTSATIAHLTGEKLNAMKIALPPIELQRNFVGRVTAVEKLKSAHCVSLAELDALFASLQHRAFRGEL